MRLDISRSLPTCNAICLSTAWGPSHWEPVLQASQQRTALTRLGSESSRGNCSRASDQVRCAACDRLSAGSRRGRVLCAAWRLALTGQALLTAAPQQAYQRALVDVRWCSRVRYEQTCLHAQWDC